MLGVAPALGRAFRPEEDQRGVESVVIISHRLWQRRFGADPSLAGKRISLNGESRTVIGVMPAHIPGSTDAFVPLALNYDEASRDSHWLMIFAGSIALFITWLPFIG